MLRPSPTAAVLLGLMAALAAGASSAAPSTTAPMGFGDARVLLHERADIMAADRAEIARAESEAEAAKSLSGPKVEMDVKQVWGTKTVDLGIDTGLGQLSGLGGQIGGVPGQIISDLAQKYNHIDIHFKEDIGGPRAAVTATLPIYTGGLITAQQNALNHKVSETRADRDMRENTLDAELAARYWGVQLARSVAALHRSVFEDQNEELRRAKRFEQKGLIAKVERLAVEVARDNARRTLVSAESDVDVAEAELMRQLRATSLPELSSPLFVLTGDLGTLEQWQNRADAQSPAIRKMNALRAQANEGISAAEAREDLANTGARVQEKDAARADWERAKAALTLASKTYERVDALYREGLIPAQRHDEATAQLAAARKVTEAAAAKLSAVDEGARVEDKTAAKALVDQARGGVSEVSSLASESIVKAPAAGEVTRIVMEEGEVAPAGFPLVLVTDLSDKWVVFNIREDELPGVEVGTVLKGFIPAVNRTVDLKVNWINPRGEYAVWRATRQSTGYDLRTFEVRARPVEELPALRPGMTVIVER